MNRKLKNQLINNKKKDDIFFDSKPNKATKVNADLKNLWQSEIESLLNRRYTDMSAILDALAETSLDKLNIDQNDREEMKSFLIFYFKNDPEVIEILKDIFI